jgi:hypothetical protein
MATYAERLATIQAASAELEAEIVREVDNDAKRVKYAQLDELRKQEQYLARKAAREANGGIRVRGATVVN